MSHIANMITKIRNAQAVKAELVSVPYTQMQLSLASVLKDSGFIAGYERRKQKGRKMTEYEFLDITLKYEDGVGALHGVKLISKPSRRMYMKAKDFRPIRSGTGVAVVSTPEGVMTSAQARKKNVGGEILFEVW